MSGYIHIYTANGKGKTTAALGLALRAAGAGKKVFTALTRSHPEIHDVVILDQTKYNHKFYRIVIIKKRSYSN